MAYHTASIIAWCDFTWEAFATLSTGILAVAAAAYVGVKQVAIAKKQTAITDRQTVILGQQVGLEELKLRAELFDRRYPVYEAVEAYLASVQNSGHTPSVEDDRKLLEAGERARFLFDDRTYETIREIWLFAHRFSVANRRLEHPYNLDERQMDEMLDRVSEMRDKLNNWHSKLPEIFSSLRLDIRLLAAPALTDPPSPPAAPS